jgi:2-(1,2-epoxy-1,2-dihydrophenyl)acetyl-CoA isomerase
MTIPKLNCSRLEIAADGVATFTMARPDALNAMSLDLKDDFETMVRFVDGNEAVKALVITGEGRAFCAGGDVKNMTNRLDDGPGPARQSILDVHIWLERLLNIDCPVIAAVNGLAFGGGFSVALMADLVFAAPNARFCAVFARIGLMPDMGLAYTLPRAVGPALAKDLMFTGRSVSAAEGKAMGFVHTVVADGADVVAAAQAYAGKLAQGPKTAAALTKRLVNKTFQASYGDIATAEADGQTLLFSSGFSKESIRRFLDKEPALYNWDQMDRVAE